MTYTPTDQPIPLDGDTNASAPQDTASDDGNQTLAIALSTVLSVLAVSIIAGSIFLCCRYRQGRLPFMQRGVTPIDDEEIESWKRKDEVETSCDDKVPSMHRKHPSTTSLKKPPSVVVYQNPHQAWPAAEETSPRSFISNCNASKKSIEIPQTPVLARAPNSRPGLTDECVQGDEAFLPSPKRRPSRISKYPPNSSMYSTRGHVRALSTRSSFSFGGSVRDQWYGYGHGYGTDTDMSPRSSHDDFAASRGMPSSRGDENRNHNRIHSTSSIPPRLSLDEAYFGNLSPQPLVPSSEIGRAIG